MIPKYELERLGAGLSVDDAARVADDVLTTGGRPKAQLEGRALPWIQSVSALEAEFARRVAAHPDEEFDAVVSRLEEAGGFSRYVSFFEQGPRSGRDRAQEKLRKFRSDFHELIAVALRESRIISFEANLGSFVYRTPSSWSASKSWPPRREVTLIFLFTRDLVHPEGLIATDLKVQHIDESSLDRRGYDRADLKIVQEMQEYRNANPGVSIPGAAAHFAPSAPGAGTPESKAKRLEKKYRRRFGGGGEN